MHDTSWTRWPVGLVLGLVVANQVWGNQPSAQPPHVLFLAVDDMKDWVHCLGGYAGRVQTPHIDRLAAEGILFSNAHCPSPKCGPSRTAILTGLRPSTTGLYDNSHWWLPHLPGVVTLPAHFRSHGYRVAGAGKIFHHTAGNHPPNQWDDFQRLMFRDDPWFRGSRLNYPWSQSAPFPPGYPFSGVLGLGHENDWGSLAIAEHEYDDWRTVDYAIEFLQQPQRGSFFLACGLFRPHLPWYVPQRFFDLYPVDQIRLPEIDPHDLDDVPPGGRQLAQARQGDWQKIRDADSWRRAVQAYLASISYADEQLGRVLNALRAGPYAAQTIVVLWSDHGWHLGEKGHWHKSTLWEEATRVPLVIRVPGGSSGICRQPVSLIDLFPTLIDLCGLDALPGHDGLSLRPLLEEPDAAWERPAIVEFRQGNAAVRCDRYRYIRYRDGGEELYDHESDPHEWRNLADQAEFRHVKQRLAEWWPPRWAEPAPTKEAYHFDPEKFVWTHKATGRQTSGMPQ